MTLTNPSKDAVAPFDDRISLRMGFALVHLFTHNKHGPISCCNLRSALRLYCQRPRDIGRGEVRNVASRHDDCGISRPITVARPWTVPVRTGRYRAFSGATVRERGAGRGQAVRGLDIRSTDIACVDRTRYESSNSERSHRTQHLRRDGLFVLRLLITSPSLVLRLTSRQMFEVHCPASKQATLLYPGRRTEMVQ